MDPQTVIAIKDVLLDSVKILGPAIITAFVTYRVMSTQSAMKLQSLARTHEYEARTSLFKFYRKRRAKEGEAIAKIGSLYAETLGGIAGIESSGAENSLTELKPMLSDSLYLYYLMIPYELEKILQDLEGKKLNESKVYEALCCYRGNFKNGPDFTSYKTAKESMQELLEIYYLLLTATEMLEEQAMLAAIEKYIDA